MATSGSINYSVTRDDIITEALEQMGVLGEGQSPSTDQLTSMSRTLNMMVKAWQADGLNLFTVQKTYLFLQKNQNQYSLSSSTSDHYTTSFYRTTIDGAVSSGASSIVVDDATNISDGDYIGIKLDGGSLQWTTVNGAPVGSTVTLTAALTDDVSDAVTVYTYTTKANRPMKIMNQVIHDSVSGYETPIDRVSRNEYITLPLKTSDGQVNQIYYDPQVGTGVLYVWPETDSVDDYLVLWTQRTIEDFDSATDDADYPQEWYLPLALNLAALSCTKYGVPGTQRTYIAQWAQYYKTLAESFDTEGGFQLQPDVD